jgi:hypothetical protein
MTLSFGPQTGLKQSLFETAIDQHLLGTYAVSQAPLMSNQHCVLKNEQHLNTD